MEFDSVVSVRPVRSVSACDFTNARQQDCPHNFTLEPDESLEVFGSVDTNYRSTIVNNKQGAMALELHIPPCIHDPVHPNHLPPEEKPLRINIEGPFVSIQKLVPEAQSHIIPGQHSFPQPAGPILARLAFEKIYGRQPGSTPGDFVVRDEYLGWVMEDGKE